MMITQAIKRWLHKLSGWWPWKKASPETEYASVRSMVSKNITPETISRSTIDGVTPQSGVAHLVVGQGEVSCSTIDERPEPSAPQPSSLPPSPPVSTTSEKTEPSKAPALEAAEAPTEQPKTPEQKETTTSSMPTPTAEQQLEFLRYLVKRGIVNEGFAEGQTPEQYRS